MGGQIQGKNHAKYGAGFRVERREYATGGYGRRELQNGL
jgi:hypothetical protein